MAGIFEVPKTEKNGFIKAAGEAIHKMKDGKHITYCFEHTVICKSETNDAELEGWNITFHNIENSNKFKAYIKLWVKWKGGRVQNVSMPFETWDTKKDFLSFLERECDK